MGTRSRTPGRREGRTGILMPMLFCASVVAYILVWTLYVVFYPIAFVDRLFEAPHGVHASVTWSKWTPWPQDWVRPSTLLEPPSHFRDGTYAGPVHDFHVVQARCNGAMSGRIHYLPGKTTYRLNRKRSGVAVVLSLVLLAAIWLSLRWILGFRGRIRLRHGVRCGVSGTPYESREREGGNGR